MVAQKRASPLDDIFEDVKAHYSATRVSTQFVIAEILRQNFPNHHVTCSSMRQCDLLGFAKAGHAETTPVLGDERFDIVRYYSPPPRRTESGGLANDTYFAQHTYKWQGVDFILFQVQYDHERFGTMRRMYVLAPRDDDQVVNGLHKTSDALLLEAGAWTQLLHDEIYVFDDAMWHKSGDLWKSVQGSSWDDVVLNPRTKQSLIEDVHGFFDSRDLYREFAVPWKRGIILHGLPGNGKTMSIKALMNTLWSRPDSIPTLYVKSLRSCDGPQYSVRSIFSQARATAPCLLILEDLDSLIVDEVRSYFLNEVDGLESNDGILMIGSTNHLDKLDPAISKRPSRFDRKYRFDLPAEAERTAYCEYWKKKLSKNNRIEFPQEICPVISKLTEGFTFAYMKELFVATLLVVARGGKGEEPVVSETEPDKANVIPSSAPTEESKSEEEPKDEAEEKPRRVLPEVQIPESMRDNILLKVFLQQATILLTEMDSTKPEEWKSSAPDVAGGEERVRIARISCSYDSDSS